MKAYSFTRSEHRFVINSVKGEIHALEEEIEDLSQYGLEELEMLKGLLAKLKGDPQ